MAKKKDADAELLRVLRETAKLSLVELRLLESHSKLGAIRKGPLPSKATNNIDLDINIDTRKKIAVVTARLQLLVTYEDSGEGDVPILVSATFRLRYGLANPLGVKYVQQAVQSVALLNIWPYWREFIQSIMSRMALPPFPLPLVRPTTLIQDGEQVSD